MTGVPLLVDIFFDYALQSGSILAISLGTYLISFYYFQNGDNPMETGLSIGAATGVMLILYSHSLNYGDVMIMVAMSAGKLIEGAAILKLYVKATSVLKNRSLNSSGSIVSRVLLKAGSIFLVIVFVWFVLFLFIFGPLESPLSYAFQVGWTLLILGLSIVGLSWKIKSVRRTIPVGLLVGIILLISGAEIYNLSSFSLEITSYILSNLAFSVGYWWGLLIWYYGISHDDEDDKGLFRVYASKSFARVDKFKEK